MIHPNVQRLALAALFALVAPALAWADDEAAGPRRPDTARIVVIGGSLTEIVFALGRGGSVVGVDRTSMWPPAVETLPQVGYYKNVSAEGVLSLAPTLVLAYRDAEPAGALRQIEQAGTPVMAFGRTPPLPALMENIEAMGEILGVPDEAARLGGAIRRDLDAVAHRVAGISPKPRVLFLHNYGPGQMVVAGRDTVTAQLIELAGGINAAADVAGFKPLSAEMLAVIEPDLVLTNEDRWKEMGGAEGMKRLQGMADTPAGRADRFAALPGPLIMGLGPRIGEAVRRLAEMFHGERGAIQ